MRKQPKLTEPYLPLLISFTARRCSTTHCVLLVYSPSNLYDQPDKTD
ncbi:uncharacterized protein METZ01_LOCUS27520 [marine metagenome]|uniref:Uncharacterized protein n=1 Tax=marine metagenome TaxID=408172 RepID=A0A381Q5N3_9ZZZZ